MEQTSSCCLCLTPCNEFKTFYDNTGQFNQFYEITVKYFDSLLLNPRRNHASTILCLECWTHIDDFHSYQQSIIRAQSQLDNVKLNQMLSTHDNEPFSVFDIIHIKSDDKSITLSDFDEDSAKRVIQSELNSETDPEENWKRRKLDDSIAICEGELKCVVCKETFSSYTLLSTHFQNEHPDQEWNIICCDRKFYKRCKLVSHMRQFHNPINENSYNCECCAATFPQFLSLKKHILKEHTKEALTKYISNYNSKPFKKQIPYNDKLDGDSTIDVSPLQNRKEEDFDEEHSNDLQDNISLISIDSNDIDEIYEVLKESPEKEGTLSIENQVHCSSIQKSNNNIIERKNKDKSCVNKSRKKVTPCSESNDTLYDSNFYDKKQTILENDNLIAKLKGNLECPQCKKKFAYLSLLNEHFLSKHPNVSCHIVCCNSKFFKCNQIVTHLGQCHARNDENLYSCQMCGASFTQYGSLRRHIRRKHAVQSLLTWLCKYCNAVFKTRASLESHKRKVHSKNKNINPEYSEDEQKSDQIKENIDLSSRVSNKNNDINELVQENDESSVYIPNETLYNCVASNDHIQQPPLEIVDIKDEILISSDNESLFNYPNNVTTAEPEDDSYFETEQNISEYDAYIFSCKESLKCLKCIENFENFLSLDQHFQHHTENGCYIICCKTKLYNRRLIVEHLREYHTGHTDIISDIHHTDPSRFRCDVCDKGFKNNRSLASHKRQVHIVKRSKYHLHLCYCKQSEEQENFKLSAKYDTVICCERKQKTLEDDAIIAKWKQELKCRLCEATFSYYSMMHAHFYYEHPGEKCYIICCERNFNRMSDALEHIRIHLDPFAFKCEICNLPFAGKSSLAKHMRLIHGETLTNKFACNQCSKSFSHSFVLTRHKNLCHTIQDE